MVEKLRQASLEHSAPQFERRPEIPASGPRRTRPAPSACCSLIYSPACATQMNSALRLDAAGFFAQK
ncbi:MAG: hypothetical protein DMG35_11230 [Acidobacteria bacterium]|nr:MAG: hypothetical protein DMG35_11230 [Acidobacteriota bacterium]